MYNNCSWKLIKYWYLLCVKQVFLKQLTSFKKLNFFCYQKRTKYHLKFKGKESESQVICPRMDSWVWSKPQSLNLIFLSFKSALQVTLICATQPIHLNIASDVDTSGWTKVNKGKSFQNLATEICNVLPQEICRTVIAVRNLQFKWVGSQRSNPNLWFLDMFLC